MTRRRRRQSARRLRDATREALRKDLSTHPRRERDRGWRKPVVIHGSGGWSIWIDRIAALSAPVLYFGLHWELQALTLLWGPPLVRKLTRGPALELSRKGVRLLRARPRRTIPWRDVQRFSESSEILTFEESKANGAAVRHTVPGVASAQRFRAASIFHAQTAANVFD